MDQKIRTQKMIKIILNKIILLQENISSYTKTNLLLLNLMQNQGLQKKHIKKSLLGQGTFGKVYKCLNTRTQKNQAIKVIENVSLMNVQSLQNEAETMMKAKSDNTVPLINHYYDQIQQSYIFVMPYYKKGNLSKLMEQKWPQEQILCFLYQICHAFLSIQLASCWHLDLKPDNIIIKNDGQYLICDFGCAKLVGGDMEVSRFLALSMGYGKGMGTTLYAAPQIIIDMEGGNYSDMWSLGVILYYILYKKHPLDSKNKPYSTVIKQFIDGKYTIQFPKISEYENSIQICKQMLRPKKRLSWNDLKNRIYKILKIPLRTPIICSVENFIMYAHDVERIVFGLIYYINNLGKNLLNQLQISSSSKKITNLSKAYIWLLFDKVEEALVGQSKGYVEFYLFKKTKENIRAQQIQRIQYLSSRAKEFTKKEYSQINDPSLVSMEMVFNEQIKNFLQVLSNNLQQLERPKAHLKWQKLGHKINPTYQIDKILKICEFIGSNKNKMSGLTFADKDIISDFAQRIVYD